MVATRLQPSHRIVIDVPKPRVSALERMGRAGPKRVRQGKNYLAGTDKRRNWHCRDARKSKATKSLSR